MERTDRHRWPSILYFTIAALIFSSFMYYLAIGATNPTRQRAPSATGYTKTPYEITKLGNKIILHADTLTKFGKTKLKYRGVDSDYLLIDVYILDLDPQYGYAYKIPIKSARKNFRLYEHTFTLVSQNKSKVSLRFIK